MAETIKIGGELESTATGNVVAAASAIKDKAKGKYQSQINAETDDTLAEHGAGIRALNSQNYVTVSDYASLPQSGQSADTVYRVSNYDGALSAVDSTKYSEYAWNGAQYLLLSVKPAIEEVFDVSEYNASGGSYATYTDLADLLANHLADIPPARRKGGMSIKFVLTSDNKYVQYRLMADEFTTDTTQWAIADEGVYVESPEFIYVKTDKNDKILWAIKVDGGIYYGAGVPQQVIDYIENKIADLSLDEYEDIVDFLNGLEEGDKTLQELLNEKVDKEDGKSLIDEEYASTKSTIESPEFIDLTLDAEDKVLEGTQQDGTKLFGGDVKVLGNMDIQGVTYTIISNPEWLAVWLDASNAIIFGLKTDGKTYVGDADFLTEIKNNQVAISEINSIVASISSTIEPLDIDTLSLISTIESPEFIYIEIDKNDKILSARRIDGTRVETTGIETPKVDVGGNVFENINDPEQRIELKIDASDKIISFRDKEGVLHEESGIEAAKVKTDSLELTKDGMKDFEKALDDSGYVPEHTKQTKALYWPKYGTVDIKSETFYLTYDARYSGKNDVVLIQTLDDTIENAAAKLTLAYYYIKSTLTPTPSGGYDRTSINENSVMLDFYAATKVTEVSGIKYVTSTLTEVIDPVTSDVSYEVNADSVRVTEITDTPPYMAWPVDKKTEHYCVVDIDFGHYYAKSNIPMGVKYQGSSTLMQRKRNFRFTFYKNSSYAKKDKIKIGGWVRLSGYNLKANYGDTSKIKEILLYAIILSIWEQRPITDRFPWDKEFGYYTGATGFVEGFDIRTSIGGQFYGMQTFTLKKDEKNYMLDGDDDHSGIFVCGNRRDPGCWTNGSHVDWDEEMMDEMSQETADAIDVFYDYINDRLEDEQGGIIEFNTETAPERMDVLGFIDYFICLQTFVMWDSTCRNMVMHTRSDKKKFYPFFYDLDLCFRGGPDYHGDQPDADIFEEAYTMVDGQKEYWDMSLWEHIRDMYWDEIVNRWCELRQTVLTADAVTHIYHLLTDSIPDADYTEEVSKWGNATRAAGDSLVELINQRLVWLDENYFKV